MSQQGAHSYEDKLLEFAYGELPSAEVRSVEAHVKGCARCAGALASIRGVRRTMATVEPEPAPDAGLESLLAYANQAARRFQAGPAPSNTRLRRWVFSLAGVASLAILGVVATRVAELTKTPAAQVDDALRKQRADLPAPAPQPVAQAAPPEEAQAALAGRADKLPLDAMNSTEAGKRTFPSTGDQLESAKAYVPPAGSGALDRRDYSQRLAKPSEPPAKKKAASKSDLDTSGWGDARLQNRAGGGSPGGATLDNQLDAKHQAAQVEERKEGELRRLSLRTAPKDALAEPAPAGDDFADEVGTEQGQAANGPAAPKAPESDRREIAQAEQTPPQTSMSISTGTRQRSPNQAPTASPAPVVSPETDKSERVTEDRSNVLLRSRQEKLRAQIESTREQSKLIDLYSQLCEIEIEIGLYQPASCQHIVQTFPGMNAAKLARNLLDAQRQRVLEQQRTLDEEKAAKSNARQ